MAARIFLADRERKIAETHTFAGCVSFAVQENAEDQKRCGAIFDREIHNGEGNAMKKEILDLKSFACDIRLETVKALSKVGAGHIGGAMSMADLMAVLYGGVMRVDPKNPKWEDRDWLVVSKGHSGPSLYAALALRGFFPMEELGTINAPHTRLPSHCDRSKTPGIDISTGSLGQGMSTAIGVALGNKLSGKDSYTYLVLGDGECQEGQVWEGALFAPQHKLDHLIAFVDWNKKQLDGYTDEICAMGDLARKFEEFGWYTQTVDGNEVEELLEAIEKAKAQNGGKPSLIAMNTVKGKGCSFVEGVYYNHHMTISAEQAAEAVQELEAEREALRALEAEVK